MISPAVYVELRANPYVATAFVDRFLDTMRITVDWIVEQEIWLLTAERFESMRAPAPAWDDGGEAVSCRFSDRRACSAACGSFGRRWISGDTEQIFRN